MTTFIAPKHSFVYDEAQVNVYYADKGEGLPRHEHNFAHATFCTGGSCIIRKKDKELIVTKDSKPVNLLASEWHEIEALEDNTVFINVFSVGKY